MMELLGYFGALVMGLVLGLLGGGGSILTVPILVYLFAVDPVLATGYSLFVVGVTSAMGAVSHLRLGHVDVPLAVIFGIPSILAVYATRAWLLPLIPDTLFTIGDTAVDKGLGILLLFAVLMVLAAASMIRGRRSMVTEQTRQLNKGLILLEGLGVGMLTGLVGAGGGFLIIPVLVLLARLPMKVAVGTSLLIIAAKSLLGFIGDLQRDAPIEWNFLLLFTAIGMVGILFGALLSRRVSNERLRPAFGWFVLVMGVAIVARELVGL